MDAISINGNDVTWTTFSRMAGLTVRHDLDLRGMPGNYMPSGLTVVGSLDLHRNENVTRLGKGLRVHKDMDISGSGVDRLEEELFVGGSLVAFRTLLKTFPASVRAASLMISGEAFTHLPENWSTADLLLHKTSVSRLPRTLLVRGSTHISHSPLEEIPAETMLNGNISVIACPLQGGMPGREFVNGSLHLEETQVRALGDRLDVAGPCTIAYTPLTRLPKVFRAEGDVNLVGTHITCLSRNFSATGSIDLRRTRIEPRGYTSGAPIYLVNFATGPRIIIGKRPLEPEEALKRYPEGTLTRETLNRILDDHVRPATVERQPRAGMQKTNSDVTSRVDSVAA